MIRDLIRLTDNIDNLINSKKEVQNIVVDLAIKGCKKDNEGHCKVLAFHVNGCKLCKALFNKVIEK